MFDQGAFDQMPFDRVVSINVYGSFVIESSGEILVTANIIVQPGFEIENSSEIIFGAIRERFGEFILDSVNEMEVEGTRERYGRFIVEGKIEVIFSAARFHVDVIEFNGQFKPGDRIIIDSEKLKVTLNNQNALHLMQGDFFDLNTGNNELTYTDNQTGRTVRIRVTHKDKFV